MDLLRIFGLGRSDRHRYQRGPLSPWADDSHLANITYQELFGGISDAAPISREAARRLGVIARGEQLIKGQIASMPLVGMRGTSTTDDFPLLRQVEQDRPLSYTLRETLEDLIYSGVAFWRVSKRDASTYPRYVRYIPLARVHITSDAISIDDETVAARDIIGFEAPHGGILNGGAGQAIRDALELRNAARLAARNPVPSVELHQVAGEELSDKEIVALLRQWQVNQERSKAAFTNKSIEVRTHGQHQDQLLTKSEEQTVVELARILNLPAWAVDGAVHGSSVTYSNQPSRARELVDMTLAPYMNAITDRLSLDDVLPRGVWARFDTSALLRLDLAARMTAYKTALDAGIYTLDDVKRLEAGIPLE